MKLGFDKSKKALLHILPIVLLAGCAEELVPGNPFDPENPDYIPPVVTITSGPVEGEVVNIPTVTFIWEGNETAMLFRYKFDDKNWSGWVSATTKTLEYIDEGDHQFRLQSKYTTGDTSEVVEVSFVVDAIIGPSLRLYQLYTSGTKNQQFSLDIMAEELTGVSGAEIDVEFDINHLALDSVWVGDFFSSNGGQTISFDSLNVSSGDVSIDIGTLGGDPVYVNGTGVIVTLYFTPFRSGQTIVSFQESSTLRDPDNALIDISSLVQAIVDIQ